MRKSGSQGRSQFIPIAKVLQVLIIHTLRLSGANLSIDALRKERVDPTRNPARSVTSVRIRSNLALQMLPTIPFVGPISISVAVG